MARIPIGVGDGGQLGRSVAEAQGAVRVDPAAFGVGVGAAAGQAVEAFGREVAAERQQERALMQAEQRQMDAEARQAARQAAAEAAQAERERRRIAQLTARAEITNELDGLQTEIATGIADGSVPRADGLTRWQGESEARITAALERFDPDMRDLMRAELLGARNRLGVRVQEAATRRAQSEVGAQLMQLGEQYQRMALTDRGRATAEFEGALAEFGPRAGLNPEQMQAQRQGFRERVAFDVGSALVRGARNDLRALDQVAQRLGSDEFADLDPGRRGQLEGQLLSRREALLNQQERAAAQAARAAEARQAAAGRAFDALDKLTLSGQVPDTQFAAQVLAATQGTPYAQAARQVIETAAARANLAAQPLPQQRAALLAAQSQAAQEGTNPAAAARVDLIERTIKQTEAALAADPLRAGLERGWIQEVAPLNVTDLQALPGALAARVEAAGVVGRQAGRAVSPFLAEEVAQISRTLAALQPRQQVDAIGAITSRLPPAQVRALAEQMGRDGVPGLASIALHLSNNSTSMPGRRVAELIANGQALISTRSVKLDTAAETGIRSQIRERIRGAYPTRAAEDMAVEDAFRIYATFHSEGRQGASAVRNAADLATGGVVEINGKRTVTPYGWTEAMMRDGISRQVPATISTRAGGALAIGGDPITAEDLYTQRRRWQLGTTATPGEYTVAIGERMVTRADGQPFTIRLDR